MTVTACTSGPTCASGIIGTPQKVSVSYTITGVATSKSSLAYTLNLTPAAADYTQTLPVTANPGFSATSSVDWLTLSPISATTPSTQLQVTLVQSAVDTFESGEHKAVVTLSAPQGNSVLVPVTLTIAKPQLDQVAPYVALSNTSASVILRGSYLDTLPANSIDLSLTPTGGRIALSADGRDLIASSSPRGITYEKAKINVLSPITLAVRQSLQRTIEPSYFRSLAVLNDNDVLMIEDSYSSTGGARPMLRYSLKNNNSFVEMTYSTSTFNGQFDRGNVVVSGDGQRVVAADSSGSSAAGEVWEYSAGSANNVMTKAPPYVLGNSMYMDRTGDTLLMLGQDRVNSFNEFARVYARDWTVRGSLPFAPIREALLSPDGTRAYTYELDHKVHVYDLTAPPISGNFPELTAITLVASPESRYSVRMAITPDGHTLFVAGDEQVVVQALP